LVPETISRKRTKIIQIVEQNLRPVLTDQTTFINEYPNVKRLVRKKRIGIVCVCVRLKISGAINGKDTVTVTVR
jgi:hypothetical protein